MNTPSTVSTGAVRMVNPLEDSSWDETLPKGHFTSVFHTQAWCRVLVDAYQYRPCYAQLDDHQGRKNLWPVMEIRSALTGCRGVGLPFTDVVEPLLPDPGRSDDLLEALRSEGQSRGWRFLEIRSAKQSLRACQPSAQFVRHELSLTGDESERFSRLHTGVRRNVRKAEGEHVQVHFDQDKKAMAHFCRLHDLTRRRHGRPPQPRRFFQLVQQHILEQNLGFVALAECQNRMIAANVYLHFRGGAIYKYGASDPAYQNLRGSHLVMWAAMGRLADQGCTSLCLGRTDLNQGGLIRFKNGWGATSETLRYFRFPLHGKNPARPVENEDKNKGRLRLAIMQHLPLPILRLAGRILYRHVG